MDNQRTPFMDCLLCLTNKATKENSHIIPKFLGKSMLGEMNQKRGYTISSVDANNKPGIEQDTPKESFILCPYCEKYFGILETEFAGKIYNKLWDEENDNSFSHFEHGGIKWMVSNQIEPIIFHLFIYSIIWRCSITSSPYFSSFKLESGQEESLREILVRFNRDEKGQLISSVQSFDNGFSEYQYFLMSAESFDNKTNNSFLAVEGKTSNDYWLVLNEFSLLFSFYPNPNINDKVKIGLLKPDDWNKGIRENTMKIIANQLIKGSNGEVPWLFKPENKGKF